MAGTEREKAGTTGGGAAAVESTERTTEKDPSTCYAEAQAITRRNVMWSLGAGVVPIPVADVLAVMAVQVKLLSELSQVYGRPFSDSIAKKLVGTLLASTGVVGLGVAIGASLGKLVPVLGSTLGVVTVPIIAGAVTHAMGTVFTMHFEAGGTLLDFDPRAMRTYFRQEFEKAKEGVASLQQDLHGKTSTKSA